MRPIYETSSNRAKEHAAAVQFAAIAHCDYVRHDPLFAWDYTFTREGKAVAFIEVKCRTTPSTKYAQYMVSESKCVTLCNASKLTGVAAVLLVQWSDCLGWLRIDGINWTTATGGRRDRNDPLDIEPMAYFDVDCFTFWTSPHPHTHIPPTSSAAPDTPAA